MSLVDTTYIDPIELDVPLKYLPPNDELVGPDPSPAFLKNVREIGIKERVHLVEAGKRNGRKPRWQYDVIGGRRRIKAWRIVMAERGEKNPQIAAAIWPAGWDTEALTITLNTQRSANPASDLKTILALRDQGHWDQKDICAKTGIPSGTVKRRTKLLELPQELVDAVLHGKMSAEAGERALRLDTAGQNKLIEMLGKQKSVKVREVQDLLRAGTIAAQDALPDELFDTPDVPAAAPAKDGDFQCAIVRALACVNHHPNKKEIARCFAEAIEAYKKGASDEPKPKPIRSRNGAAAHAKREVDKTGDAGDKQPTAGPQRNVRGADGIPARTGRGRKGAGAGGVHSIPAEHQRRGNSDRAAGQGGANDTPAGNRRQRKTQAQADSGGAAQGAGAAGEGAAQRRPRSKKG